MAVVITPDYSGQKANEVTKKVEKPTETKKRSTKK